MKQISRLKIALAVLSGVLLTTVGSGIAYLESESFALTIKKMISERSTQRLGVIGDFSHLKIYFFPPAIGVADPKIRIERENVARLALEGEVEAKELRASFAPFQMFSGVLRVDEVEIKGGAVHGRLFRDLFSPKAEDSRRSSKVGWKDLFEIQINGVHFIDTYLNVVAELPAKKREEAGIQFVVKDLWLKREHFVDREGFRSKALVRAVKLEAPKSWGALAVREASELQWDLGLTDLGLNLNPLTLDIPGVRLTLNGILKGNLLDENSTPELSAKVDARSDLGVFFLAHSNDESWSGDLRAQAEVEAKLPEILKTLRARGTLDLKAFSKGGVVADSLQARGDLDLGRQRVRLEGAEILAGKAGGLKIEPTEFSLTPGSPITGKLVFNGADLHWLGGVVPNAMAPLEGKISGSAGVRFQTDRKGWGLQVDSDLSVDHFELTNQKFGEPRPLKRILRPPYPLLLKGGLEIRPNGLDFREFGLQIRKSRFKVVGGVHADSGFEFTAKGPVEMDEVREIAGSTIRGQGTLSARIHGTASELLLDFDPQLTHASYLDLDFGNLRGRVTYDDGISELRFTEIKANQGNTFYSLKEGYIDLSGADDLHLPIEINSGRVEDLSVILKSLTQKISWFPSSLKGELHGSVDIGGKVDAPRMVIQSQIEGSDWSWMGERARRLKMNLGYDHGIYFARNVNVIKSSGALRGKVEFDSAQEQLDWTLDTDSLSLNDLDFFERLRIPARSRIEVHSEGSGKMGHLKSTTRARAFDTEVKGEQYRSSELEILIGENQLKADATLFGGQGISQIRYSLIPRQPSSFRVELNELDFSPLLLILNPKMVDDAELVARISGRVNFDFLSTQFELARGMIELNRYDLEKNNFSLKLADRIQLPVQLGYFQMKPARFLFNRSELRLSGTGSKGDVDFRLEGDTDLALAEMLTPALSRAVGTAETRLRIHGPLKGLQLDGEITFTGARFITRWMQSPIEEADGSLLLDHGRILIENFDAYLGEEVISVSGKIDTFTDRFPEIDLRGTLDNNKIKMDPFDVLQARGTLTVKGGAPPYQIGGSLDLAQALYTKGFGQSAGSGGGRGERFMPKDEERQMISNFFNLEISLNAAQGFYVRNEIIDAEFRGKARLIGTPESPRLLGEGRLVQGKVLFKDRPFVFENARIEFDDPYQLNPKFNVSAVSEVNQYKIRVLAYGRSSQWKAEFSSTPYLRENDIFAVLSSGATSADSSRFTSRDRSLVNQGEAASLILHSMDFSKDVQSKTGFQFDVQEAVDSQTANSIFRPQNLSENMAAPKVVLKRSVGRNMSVSFGSTVGVGSRNQKEVNAEYKLNGGMSMLGVWNNIEGVNTRESRTSFGLDLKFNKRFK